METLTLKIHYRDRLGLVVDVSTVLLKYGLNIEALQLMNNMMYLEIRRRTSKAWGTVVEEVRGIPFILSVERIEEMPFRLREKQMAAIMNSMSPPEAPIDAFAGILGESQAIREVLGLARRVAETDSTVMLRGESGTGKELFAKAIHYASRRRDRVFVPLNCGAIPEHLLESELFGYREGAFSGAKKGGRVGLFHFANGGTLFLDEITELPMTLQVKLLRVLQEGRVRPLGANEETAADTRIITATNQDVEAMVAEGRFREDLYYRLNVIPLRLPPLRRRREDIPLLAESLLAKHRGQDGQPKYLSQAALDRLQDYPWPGNVRELENVMNRALHLSREQEISTADLVFDSDFGGQGRAGREEPLCEGMPVLKDAANRAERRLISSALSDHGSLRAAARALGVSHTTIANKVKKLGIGVK